MTAGESDLAVLAVQTLPNCAVSLRGLKTPGISGAT
jgi:hypothetical protein